MDILNLFSAAFDLKYVENTTFKKKNSSYAFIYLGFTLVD